MDKLWEIVQRYVAANATHRTKGYSLASVKDEFVLTQAFREMVELMEAPQDVYEMVDTLGCLFHYCMRKGWDKDALASAMEEKLKLRFYIKGEDNA